MKNFPDLPPIWALGHLLLSFVADQILPIMDISYPGSDNLGYGALVIGVGIGLWSAWWFWRKRTPIEPHYTPKALIIEGPYRLNRNPIYTGMLICLVGFATLLGSLSALLVVIPFPFIITNRFIKKEEDALRDAFGDKTDSYFAITRRW